jgi:hypothetical protein
LRACFLFFAINFIVKVCFVALSEAVQKITIPIELAEQWEDELALREAGVSLFDTFGSEKTLHKNPGARAKIPALERSGWEHFLYPPFGQGQRVILNHCIEGRVRHVIMSSRSRFG